MRFFKPSRTKIVGTIVVSSLLVFFFVPVIYQLQTPTCNRFEAADGTCSIQNQDTYPFMNPGYPGPMQYPPPFVTFYPLSSLLLHEMPKPTTLTIPVGNPSGNTFYPYFIIYVLLIIILSYILFCMEEFTVNKLRNKKKSFTASSKK